MQKNILLTPMPPMASDLCVANFVLALCAHLALVSILSAAFFF
jgi:hypothetical protein